MKMPFTVILSQILLMALYGQNIEIYPAYLDPQPNTYELPGIFENLRIYIPKEPLFSSEAGDVESYEVTGKKEVLPVFVWVDG